MNQDIYTPYSSEHIINYAKSHDWFYDQNEKGVTVPLNETKTGFKTKSELLLGNKSPQGYELLSKEHS